MRHETIYMTAEQLDIPQVTRDGLVALADDLAAGRIEYESVPSDQHCRAGINDRRSPPRTFNMSFVCGTACCIGGYLRWRGHLDDLAFDDEVFKDLFYPEVCDLPTVSASLAAYDAITPVQAAVAIRNFLGCGDPCWARVLRVED